MAKRGAKAQGEYTGRSEVFSSRITPETMEKLREASKASGRSISQEFETRIVRSFREDMEIDKVFGSKRTFALMRIIAAAAENCWRPDRDDVNWLDDPWLFDQAHDAINLILASCSPPRDETKADPPGFDYPVGGTEGAKILSQVAKADPALPFNKGTRLDHRLASIKGQLDGLEQRAARRWGDPHLLENYSAQMKQPELDARAKFKAKTKKGKL